MKDVGIKTAVEMRTLALAMDARTSGHLPQVADLPMQRFKTFELAVDQNDWTLAIRRVDNLGRSFWRS